MNKSEIIQELKRIQHGLTASIQPLTQSQFDAGTDTSWSASGYLKHLILSNKPFVRGLSFPKDKLADRFGQSTQPPRSYDALVAMYQSRLDDGIRAEDYEAVTPISYRLPEGITDEKAYFIEVWNETHEKMFTELENWEDADLDKYQLPHPAINLISIREMLYFTIYHNNLHWNDIQAVIAS